MKFLMPALLALTFASQFAQAQSLSEDYDQQVAGRSTQHAQMMSVWQEQSCRNTIGAVAAQQKEQIVQSHAARGPFGDTNMYVTAKLSNGVECSCVVEIGGEPTVSCN
jgi:hypothetical protein